VQAAFVDSSRATRGDSDARRCREHERKERLAVLRVVHLRVVELRERAHLAAIEALVVEQDRGCYERAGEAAATCLVRAGDEARAQRPVEAEQPRRGPTATLAVRGSGSV
jgi:hypothetical protein